MTGKALFAAALGFALWGAASDVSAQSFDCTKAETPAETMICSAPLLASLDEELALVYQAARQVDETGKLAQQQRNWLQTRTLCEDEFECLKQSYLTRIQELDDDTAPLLQAGRYVGQNSELEIEVSGTPADGYSVVFTGISANYICETDPAMLRSAGSVLFASTDEAPLLELIRVGSGLLLPDTGVNRDLKRTWCGARAPQVVGSFFRRASR